MSEEQMVALNDLVYRIEEAARQMTMAAETMWSAASANREAASTMASAASGNREAAGTMYMAARR